MKFATYVALVGVSNQVNIRQYATTVNMPATGTTATGTTTGGPQVCNMNTIHDTQCAGMNE